jgi:hypothetical protein
MVTSDFKFECPHCKQHLQCEVQFAGRQIECPSCHHLINIPNPPAGHGFTRVTRQRGKTWDTFVPPPRKIE